MSERMYKTTEAARAAGRKYYYANLETRRASNKRQYYKNLEKRRTLRPRWRRLGLNWDSVLDMVLTQDGRCAVCGDEFLFADNKFPGHVDHCHATGRVRGLTCVQCNAGLGMFKDDPARLTAAIEYLERNKT